MRHVDFSGLQGLTGVVFCICGLSWALHPAWGILAAGVLLWTDYALDRWRARVT